MEERIEVEARKIKDIRRAGKRIRHHKIRRPDASIRGMVRFMGDGNPMKNPEIAKKHVMIRRKRGTIKNYPFPKGNQYGKGRKTSDKQRQHSKVLGLSNIGKKQSIKQRETARQLLLTRNPMRNGKVHAVWFKNGNQISKGRKSTPAQIEHCRRMGLANRGRKRNNNKSKKEVQNE